MFKYIYNTCIYNNTYSCIDLRYKYFLVLYLINECWGFPFNRWFKNWWFKFEKRFITIYRQHGAEVNNENQNIELYYGENPNYIQIGNSYLENDIAVRKADRTNFTITDEIRLVNIGLFYIFQEGRLSTSAGTQIEHNKNIGNVSTIMRLLTQKDGDLSSYFDKFAETEASINNSTLKHMLTDSHSNNDNNGKIKANLPLGHIFGSCKTFKK